MNVLIHGIFSSIFQFMTLETFIWPLTTSSIPKRLRWFTAVDYCLWAALPLILWMENKIPMNEDRVLVPFKVGLVETIITSSSNELLLKRLWLNPFGLVWHAENGLPEIHPLYSLYFPFQPWKSRLFCMFCPAREPFSSIVRWEQSFFVALPLLLLKIYYHFKSLNWVQRVPI